MICNNCPHEITDDELRYIIKNSNTGEEFTICKECFDNNVEDIGGIN